MHDQKSDSIILTQRSVHLRHHPGEICFPGGRWDFTDLDLWSTALRELNEELGIDSSRVELIKELQPVHTFIGTVIYPWLASIDSIQPYSMNESEVSAVLTLAARQGG